MLTKIGEAFKHSGSIVVKASLVDEETGITLDEEYFCDSGNLADVQDAIEQASNNLLEKVELEFNN